MDIVLELVDTFVLDYAYAAILPAKAAPLDIINGIPSNATFAGYPASTWVFEPASKYLNWTPRQAAYLSAWPRDHALRQFLSLWMITWFFGLILYFLVSSFSYFFVFDKTTFNHPKFLKNQVRMEIKQANISMPFMAILTAFCFVFEVRGNAFLYDTFDDAPFGAWYNFLQYPFFLLFTDAFIYLIHRGLHSKLLYKRLHKPHHKWITPTPYASYAFHPVDGFLQSVPYHVFPFLFPLQKFAYVFLFVFVNIWTVIIHDGEYVQNSPIINGAACHTMHHLYFNYNYGQYTTLWDRIGGSYRKPNDELFDKNAKMSKKEWDHQAKEMEKMVVEVEGVDNRTYGPPDKVVVNGKVLNGKVSSARAKKDN